jgi:succinyl-CoA synthetase alpha subunit
VFGTVQEAMAATGANVSVVFVPPAFTKAAVIEAVDAAMPLVIVITEGVPVHDTADFFSYAQAKGSTRIIGPNCPGIISPGRSNAGIIPADITKGGRIGLVSKSGTLTYQMMYELRDYGFSSCIGIGGDPIIGTTHIDALKAFQEDPETDAIVMIGEIVSGSSGTAEAKKQALEAVGVKVGKTPSGTAQLMREILENL